ncbi:MAG TPA: FAD-dependent oxidoreductase [Acidimicrobiales bacterium]|nr:FAD-dependent oxidoreductase [Acidimicrobiales bacterium]
MRLLTERLLVIGADAAGMSAAAQARRLREPDDLDIVAFDRGNFSSYSACGIPYYVGRVVDDVDDLVVRTPEVFAEKHSIEVHVRHEVVEVDLERGVASVHHRDGGHRREEGFDVLMVATGAVPMRPPLPGADAAGVFGVQTLDDGLAVRAFVDDREPRRAVIVGGGYVGLEMAEAFCGLGLETHLVDAAPQPMTGLDPDMGELVAEELRKFGTVLHLGQPVTGFETADDGRVAAVATEGVAIPADVVVLGLGVKPEASVAEAAGVGLGPSGGIAVDRRMRTSHPAVWAAGDCAEKHHRVSGRPVTVALGTHANKEGRVAGVNLGGGYATFPGVIGTAATKVGALEVARTGLNEAEAAEAGFLTEATVSESTTRAGYFPGSAPMTSKLVVEQGTGRLLGAQIVGREGSGKRIDSFALAVWNGMTVGDLLGVDLSYAPPYSPVWDPVLAAARRAYERRAR